MKFSYDPTALLKQEIHSRLSLNLSLLTFIAAYMVLAIFDSEFRQGWPIFVGAFVLFGVVLFVSFNIMLGSINTRLKENGAEIGQEALVKLDSQGKVSIPWQSIHRVQVIRTFDGQIHNIRVVTSTGTKHDFFAVSQLEVLLAQLSKHLQPEQLVQRQPRLNWDTPVVVVMSMTGLSLMLAAMYKWQSVGHVIGFLVVLVAVRRVFR